MGSSQPAKALVFMVALMATIALVLVAVPRGASAVNPKLIQVTNAGTAGDGDLVQVIASCPDGFGVTGGGFEIESINPAIFVHQDTPLTPEINEGLWGWAVTLLNDGTGGDVDFSVQAVCWKN